jgi:signal peptidase I
MKMKQKIISTLKDMPWFFIGVILLLRIGVVEANFIPTGSMQPTLPIGDWLVIDKAAYGFSIPFKKEDIYLWDTPKRGDIITFDPDHTDHRLIKRVIGVPGDVVAIRNSYLYLNGKRIGDQESNGLIKEHLGGTDYFTTPAYPRNFGPVRVPAGHLFVLGDNRANSADSRYWGYLPMNEVKGKAVMRLFSLAWFKDLVVPAKFGSLYN